MLLSEWNQLQIRVLSSFNIHLNCEKMMFYGCLFSNAKKIDDKNLAEKEVELIIEKYKMRCKL